MDIEFLLDATGVVPSNGIPEPSDLVSAVAPLELMAKIALLKRVVYNYVGDAHEPPFVKLTWALETFRCRLQSLNITYKLFKPDGTPLRALIKCSFKEYIPDNENAAVTLATSPDLTHIRIAKQGDSLPLMCYTIYGDESLYLEVARVNNLTNFRKLEDGQRIFFHLFKNKCRQPIHTNASAHIKCGNLFRKNRRRNYTKDGWCEEYRYIPTGK
ncbi:hypothetical protein KRR40_15875 [Niabella defluvii]|nr:hypothetical protein KRR40_15875 [Niabella sp. I65]